MIIGICGFKSSGKDTVADYLIKEHGYVKYSFASVVKDIISLMFGWSREKLEGLTKEDREWREQIDPWWSQTLQMPLLSPRYVMQYIATDLFRDSFHPDIWVKIVENQLIQCGNQNVVISDCRFRNEIDMIRRLKGIVIHVHRNVPKWFHEYRNGIEVNLNNEYHVSEIEWIRCYRDHDTIQTLHSHIENVLSMSTRS